MRNCKIRLSFLAAVLALGLFSLLIGCGGDSADTQPAPQTPQIGSLNAVTFANGVFVAVGEAGTIATSADGIVWTLRNSGTSNGLSAITFGDNTFIAVGAGDTIVTSPDGLTWTTVSSGTSSDLSGVAFGNNTFVAVGYGTIITSGDGATWIERPVEPSSYYSGITFGKNLFVVTSGEGGIYTSSDGIT